MIQFHLSQDGASQLSKGDGVQFAVPAGAVLIAGSRRGVLPAHSAGCLIAGLTQAGLSI